MNVKSYEVFVINSILLMLLASIAYADGTVSDDIRITSDVLGYDLQYRIYLPEDYNSRENHPVIFLTDGQNYIRRGSMPSIMNSLIGNGKIQPVIAVFVDARDPDNLESNRRRTQFFCKEDYLKFYIDELVPSIENEYPVIKNREG
jgi:enterochelin esterase-like enzyme